MECKSITPVHDFIIFKIRRNFFVKAFHDKLSATDSRAHILCVYLSLTAMSESQRVRRHGAIKEGLVHALRP